MKFDIMTLFPEMVSGILSESIIGRAQKAGLISITCHNIRDYSDNKHKNVDDTPFGGGRGMVMAAPPIAACIEDITKGLPADERRRIIYLSPKGKVLTQAKASSLLAYDRLILLCGHYEGIDQRVLDEYVDEEISIGDYVLTGGELPACVLVDTVARMVDGVLAMPECFEDESIASGLLEYPQYTRPPVFRGSAVPEVLLSGNHQAINAWRHEAALALTRERRPDLYEAYLLLHPAPPPKKKRRPTKDETTD
ncbi:MAG: tRNA (guanosine(37)-N1)-methyltransferase TrmD [Clostridia bacterium]|nr:tRNA (guanosine(37)-N1)-methyltransferase TrmD [Clostridia bacterium]